MKPPKTFVFLLAALVVGFFLALVLTADNPQAPSKPAYDATQLPDGELVIVVKDGEITRVKRLPGPTRPIVVLRLEEEPPTDPPLKKVVEEALGKVPDYPKRDTHRKAIAIGYLAVAERVKGGQPPGEASAELSKLRQELSGGDSEHWAAFFTAVDAALGEVTKEKLAAVGEAMLAGEALNPGIIALIKRVVGLLPNGNFKRIAEIILAVLEALG